MADPESIEKSGGAIQPGSTLILHRYALGVLSHAPNPMSPSELLVPRWLETPPVARRLPTRGRLFSYRIGGGGAFVEVVPVLPAPPRAP
jgi:hypothetical protein